MSYRKTQQEITILQKGGKRMGEILDELVAMVKPGVSAFEIDQKAEELIIAAGGVPAFKGYQPRQTDIPFPGTICASLNEELVHGVPSKEKVIKDGDIFTMDIGMRHPAEGGLYTDTAVTVAVGDIADEVKKLMDVTRQALEKGIVVSQPGKSIADIGKAIEDYVNEQGEYGIVRSLSGHGVGHAVHEDPWVPNFYVKDLENWKLQPGVVIAIEPMITLGTHEVETGDDGWTIVPQDRKLNAHFEHTIAITEDGPIVITRRPSELSV